MADVVRERERKTNVNTMLDRSRCSNACNAWGGSLVSGGSAIDNYGLQRWLISGSSMVCVPLQRSSNKRQDSQGPKALESPAPQGQR